MTERFVLKHDNGSYFVCMTGFGPMFGELADAKRFEDRIAAVDQMRRHWAMGDTQVVHDPTLEAGK